MSTEIISRNNHIYKELKKLISKENSHFLVAEGMKLFSEAVKSRLVIKSVYIDKKNLSLFLKILPDFNKDKIFFIKNDLLRDLYSTAGKPDSDELIIAVLERPEWNSKDLLSSKKDLIFLEQIQDPGNLGSIIRSSLAFNIGGVFLSNGSTSPFNSKVIRGSAGAVFNLPVVLVPDNAEFFQLALKQGYKVIATSNSAKGVLNKSCFYDKNIFLFGNEGSGLSDNILKYAEKTVRIHHANKVESLNLSVAVSLVLWERYKT